MDERLTRDYWMTPGEAPAAVSARKEFVSDPRDERPGDGEFSRRDFLKLMGISTVLAGAAACARRPVEKIVPYLNRTEDATPGIPVWYASTAECPCQCGVLVKTREGRPIKLEGNPDHPMNRGALCARAQASVWNLYDPDRLQQPTRRHRDGNRFEPVSWVQADTAIRTALSGARRVRIVTGAVGGPAEQQILRDFVAGVPNGRHVVYEAINLESLRRAAADSYGEAAAPRYRFDAADVIVSLGADFLGTWLSPVEFAKDWAARRRLHDTQSSTMSKLLCFEPQLSLTGTNADERYAVRAVDLPILALALCHQLAVVAGHGTADAGLTAALAPYAIGRRAGEFGIPAAVLERVAQELWAARGKSVVVAGTTTGEAGWALQIAVNFLNDLLGNTGRTIDWSAPSRQALGGAAELYTLIGELQRGEVDCVILAGVNPVATLPESAGLAAALGKAAMVIAIADRIDETAQVADYILPLSHHLERWGDAEPRRGLYAVVQPTIAPLYDTRATGEILLRWLKGDNPTWHDYVQAAWRSQVYPATGSVVPFDRFWEGALRAGVVTVAAGPRAVGATDGTLLAKAVDAVERLAQAMSFELLLTPSATLHDGRYANNSWLQELPDPVSKITWDNYLSMAPQTAKEFDLEEGDVVGVIPSEGAPLQLPTHIQPGMHPGSVAVAIGYGRGHAGRAGSRVGVAVEGAARLTAQGLVTVIPVALAKTNGHVQLACTQGHHRIDVTVGGVSFHERPIIREASLTAYRQDPHAGGAPEVEQPSLWGAHEYKGYRWGMAIDLGLCTGCSACMAACNVENNIPVIGKAQVLKGREMHWIRIDRYYAGDEANPRTVHQPMLCQHCEKAPCETVCPVLATVHDNEGLNVQVYNRCVGTRYCSNNCPYKVRRFNWFDYGNRNRAAFAWPEPLHLMLNPDVTVREKGVMEKCTFCVQRIRTAKEDAKMRGETERVRDGELQTACQQSCPTGAIVFGDLHDGGTRVAQLARHPRGYHVLHELNILPQVTYLTKIRNAELPADEHGEGHHEHG